MNLGLNHSSSRAVRFTMYAGYDVHQGLSEAALQNKIKSNIFGRGFENGEKASVGCSYKGRLCSYRIACDISEWVKWCQAIGAKLRDETISVEKILEQVMIPVQITGRPDLVPLAIEWSEDPLQRSEESITLVVAGERVPFFEAGLELVEHRKEGPIRFRIFTETRSVEYEMAFRDGRVEYPLRGGKSVEVITAQKQKSLSEWFQEEPPVIHFEDSGILRYDWLFKPPPGKRTPLNPERIDAWDWTGTHVRKESQTAWKHVDSIQYRVIHKLLHPDHDPQYDIVFDDDSSNEAADIVALKVLGERLIIHLFHCKFASDGRPGARVEDLYAVCGQAQRSIHWKGDVKALIKHLCHREILRLQRHNVSRFERGNLQQLDQIGRQIPFLTPEFKVYIVQPGLSKSRANTSQLELLAVTELYLKETLAIEFGVIASA